MTAWCRIGEPVASHAQVEPNLKLSYGIQLLEEQRALHYLIELEVATHRHANRKIANCRVGEYVIVRLRNKNERS